MPYLTHPSGVKTFYLDDDFTDPWKPSETILIHHGFGRSSTFWYKWVPVLASRYRVIRRDALGHGHSSGTPEGHPKTVDSMLDEIIDTLDQLKVDKVHVLGESTGGIFCEFLAARNPERVHSLTIISSPLVFGPSAQAMLQFGYPTIVDAIRGLGLRDWAEKVLDFIGTGSGEGASEEYGKWLLDQWAKPSAEGIIDYADIICNPTLDANRIMDQIKVPFLALAPANSKLVNLDDQRRLVQSVEDGRLEVITGQGHEIYLDQAGKCQEKYLEFLNAVKK